MGTCIDCQEPGCPGPAGMVPKKEGGRGVHGWRGDGNPHDLLPAHLRICVLENLIVRAAGLGPGDEEGCAFLEVLREARRIVGKKKEGRANG